MELLISQMEPYELDDIYDIYATSGMLFPAVDSKDNQNILRAS